MGVVSRLLFCVAWLVACADGVGEIPLQSEIPPLHSWRGSAVGRGIPIQPPVQGIPYLAFIEAPEDRPPWLLGAYAQVYVSGRHRLVPTADPYVAYTVGWTTDRIDRVESVVLVRGWRFPGGQIRFDVQQRQLPEPVDLTGLHAGMDATGHIVGGEDVDIPYRLPRSFSGLYDVRFSRLREHEWRVPIGVRYVRHPQDRVWLSRAQLRPEQIEWYYQNASSPRWEMQQLYPGFDQRARRVGLTFSSRGEVQELPLPNNPLDMMAGAMPLWEDESIRWYVDGACRYYPPHQRVYCRHTIITSLDRILTGEEVAWQSARRRRADDRSVGDVWWWSQRVGMDAILEEPSLHRVNYFWGLSGSMRQTLLMATMLYPDRVEFWPLSGPPSAFGAQRPPLPDEDSRYDLRSLTPHLTLHVGGVHQVFLGSPHGGAMILRGDSGWYIYLIGYDHQQYGVVPINPHPGRHPSILR